MADGTHPLPYHTLTAGALLITSLFLLATIHAPAAAAFTPDPGHDATGTSNEINIDTTVTNTTLLQRLQLWIPDIPTLAFVDPGDETYAPGDTVEIEFGDTADHACNDAWFGVEIREPGSSTTTQSASDPLTRYDGSVFEDQLVTGEVTIQLPSDAQEGEWDVMGYLYCEETDSIVGDHDTDSFIVEAADEPDDDTTAEPDKVTRWFPSADNEDCVADDVEAGTGDGYGSEDECLDALPDPGEDAVDDGHDDITDDDDNDVAEDRAWLDQVFLDLWNRLTGFLP